MYTNRARPMKTPIQSKGLKPLLSRSRFFSSFSDSSLESRFNSSSLSLITEVLSNSLVLSSLDFLDDLEREVFKTFGEISQLSVIQQAAQRQKFICQSQSLNITIHPNTPTKDINKLYLTAHELGVKSLYYQHSVNAAQEFNRSLLTSCATCEG